MIVVFTAKMICNIIFYFIFANMFTIIFLDIAPVGIMSPAIIALTAMCAYLLNKYRPASRFAPIALMALCFLPLAGIASVIIMLPPCAYMIYTIAVKNFGYDIGALRDQIKFCVRLIFIPFLGFLFSTGEVSVWYENLVTANYFVFLCVFFGSAICIYRMTNINGRTESNPKIAAYNVAVVFVSFSVLIVLGSRTALNVIFRGIRLILSYTILPLMRYVILPPLFFLLNLIPACSSHLNDDFLDGFGGALQPLENGDVVRETPIAVRILIYVASLAVLMLLLILIIRVLRKVIRKLKLKSNFKDKTDFEAETRTRYVEHEKLERKKRQGIFGFKTPRLLIRHHYRNFLKKCAEKGTAAKSSDTSEDINVKNEKVFSKSDISRLRELYIKARYSEHEIAKNESKEAAELNKRL